MTTLKCTTRFQLNKGSLIRKQAPIIRFFFLQYLRGFSELSAATTKTSYLQHAYMFSYDIQRHINMDFAFLLHSKSFTSSPWQLYQSGMLANAVPSFLNSAILEDDRKACQYSGAKRHGDTTWFIVSASEALNKWVYDNRRGGMYL